MRDVIIKGCGVLFTSENMNIHLLELDSDKNQNEMFLPDL